MKNAVNPIKRVIQRALRKAGYNIYRLSEEERRAFARYDAQRRRPDLQAVFGDRVQRLQELRQRYENVSLPVAVHSVWASRQGSDAVRDIGWSGVDLCNFRGHSSYVWDYAGSNAEATNLKYYIFTEYVRRKDAAGLLQLLKEDGAFGCVTFEYPRLGLVSRDLLDSVAEINFLHRHLKVLDRDDLRVLDIGAGYGRMAHRMLEANPRLKAYTCVDAIPESTFLCEFYLRHRGLGERVEVVPLDALDSSLATPRFDVALNVHSFSECTYAAIEWWLRRLRQLEVRHLMIVPNEPTEFLSMEADGSRRDYLPLLGQLGYKIVAQEPVFEDPSVQQLIGVKDSMYLFELRQ